jgi:hopanoid biosynthesis associated protein HpnK
MPSLKVGLHIVLVDGRPVSPPAMVPNLVDKSGLFRNDMARASFRIFANPETRRQVSIEITSQFEAFMATGLKLDHVDCHKHWQLHPTIARLVLDIGQRYGMKALRIPAEPLSVLRTIERQTLSPLSPIISAFAELLRARVRRYHMCTPDRVFGLAWSGAMTESRIAGLLAHLRDGVTEIYSHPATSNTFEGAVPGYRYADELAALIAPEIVATAKSTDIRLIGYSDLVANKPGINA